MSEFKVGDRVVRTDIGDQTHGVVKGNSYVVSSVDGRWIGLVGIRTKQDEPWNEDCFELSEEGPVRTVTRKEIVPGNYEGILVGGVDAASHSRALVSMHSFAPMVPMKAHELRAAARVLNALAEALEVHE